MLFPPMGSPLLSTPREVASRCAFLFDVSLMEETDGGLFVAESGHLGVFSRGAPLAGVLDANGVSYTAVDGQPAYEMRDDGAGGQRFGWRMGAADRLAFDFPPPPSAHSGLFEFTETGARTTLNATLWAISTDAVSGARLYLDTSSSYYRMTYHNGSTSVTATLSSGQPTAGQRVRLRWDWNANGSLQLWQSINGAAETTATSGALALPSAWPADARLRINSRGASVNGAQGTYYLLKLATTVVPLATLLTLR